MMRHVKTTLPPVANRSLETTITLEEIHVAVQQGKKQKAPGCDGICHDFFLHTWDMIKDDLHTIMNQMFVDEVIVPLQKTRHHRLCTEIQQVYTS
jgi:hypothetical protein